MGGSVNLLFAPHNDDEALFCSFVIQREKPLVVIVFDGHVQAKRGAPITAQQRRTESLAAMDELGAIPPLFLGYSDAEEVPATFADNIRNLIERHKPEKVFAPAVEEGGHHQHNIVGRVVRAVFPKTTHYMTYTSSGKSLGVPVSAEPDMIRRKLRALACYQSQIELANCRDHFQRDLIEYYQA